MNYIKLYRWDVALITFLSYLVGSEIAGKMDLKNILIALFVSLISVNFIYSFNSWADWEIDKFNKPERPIPSGRLKPHEAFIYSIIIMIISLIYPFIIYVSYVTLFLFLLFPLLGIVYSLKPVRLKRYFIPATFITSTILVIPIILGYFMNRTDFSQIPFFISLFLYCLSIIPIKDVEDIKGDIIYNCENWFFKLGEKKLLLLSMGGLTFNLILIFFLKIGLLLKIYLFTFIITSIFVILIFIVFKLNLNLLYRTIIRLVIIEGIMLFFLLRFGIKL